MQFPCGYLIVTAIVVAVVALFIFVQTITTVGYVAITFASLFSVMPFGLFGVYLTVMWIDGIAKARLVYEASDPKNLEKVIQKRADYLQKEQVCRANILQLTTESTGTTR